MKTTLIYLLTLSAMMAFSAPSFARDCMEFAGRFKNIRDGLTPVVTLYQKGCEQVDMIDNDGNIWNIPLDGSHASPPRTLLAQIPRVVTHAYYTAKWADYGKTQILIEVHARLSLLDGAGNNNTVTTEVVYKATAFWTYGPSGRHAIALTTDSLRVVNVDANGVEKGQVSGFLQGANFVMDLLKSALNALLA